MTDRTHLDHVALAFERAWNGLDRYGGDLGGRLLGGGPDPGFSWYQLRFANEMKVELLEPNDVHVDDFLQRFLDRNGPGPHHMTFKVPDIRTAISRASAAGYAPLRVNLDHPHWQEAFLHPRESHGIVVQLAWSDDTGRDPLGGVPGPRYRDQEAALERVVLAVRDLDAARGLFEGVLDGEQIDDGDGELGRYVELAWPRGGRLRLVGPDTGSAAAWIGGRSGRVHHLAFRARSPVAGVAPLPDGSFELPPESNHGTRLRIRHEA